MQRALREERLHGRFVDLVDRHVLPALGDLGFDPVPGALAAADGDGVLWLLDVEPAPWCTCDRFCFTLAWGVHVPGLAELLGDHGWATPLESCAVRGRIGERDGGLEPTFFELRDRGWPLGAVADRALARRVVAAVAHDALPHLQGLPDVAAVQLHLHRRHQPGRGYPAPEELQSIRRIAALSLLLGQRENAARWLDHLACRSEAAMAPDVVAERLAPLRQLLAS